MSTCKSCGAQIIWAISANGRAIPLDVEPTKVQPGLFRLQDVPDSEPNAISVGVLYISHFATCPNAAAHRKL